jgi:oligogalacturonide lyase
MGRGLEITETNATVLSTTKSYMDAIDCFPKLNLFVFLALAAVLTPASWAQTVNGVDYSARAGVYDTFDMSDNVVFGQRFPSEHLLLIDEATGVEITALTTSRDVSSKIYQTHPQWTSDGRYIVFRSNRAEMWLYYAVSMDNHEIVQVTTSQDVRELHLGWKYNLAYYFRDGDLIEFDLGALLAASEQDGVVGTPDDYERVLATLPEGLRPTGGVGLDAERTATVAARTRQWAS